MNSINFLFFWDDIARDIVLIVEGMVRSLFYTICSAVYKMIYYFYSIFTLLCNGQLLDTDKLTNLFSRVGLLLGIVMSFRLALSFIQSIVDPDSAFDPKKGIPGVIKKVIIVIIMFGMSQYAFELSRDVQVLIIKNEVIPNLILPAKVDNDNFGGALAANFFTAFYNVDPRLDDSLKRDQCAEPYITGLQNSIANSNDFGYMKNECLKATGEVNDGSVKTKDFLIEFNYIFCLIVGIAVLWFLINYCIQVGMRLIQLTVLQIISPMAFLSYLSPKDENMFTKWWKLYFSTYIDVFIRIAIIDFVCYICALIMTEWNSGNGTFWNSVGNPGGFTRLVVGIMMILAMFQFAKKAPGLIKSLFPTGEEGSVLGFGTSKDNFKPLGYAARGAAALGAAGAFGLMSARARFKDNNEFRKGKGKWLSAAGGFGSGLVKGFRSGGKSGNIISNLRNGYNEQMVADDERRDLYAIGGTRPGQILAAMQNARGTDRGTKDDTRLKHASRVEQALKSIMDEAESSRGYQDIIDRRNSERTRGNYAEADRLTKLADTFKEKYAQASVNGKVSKGQIIEGVEIGSGDAERATKLRSAYIDLASEMNAIQTEAIGQDGQVGVELPNGTVINDFTMESADSVTFESLDNMLRASRLTQNNVKMQPGFREGQANKPKKSGSS